MELAIPIILVVFLVVAALIFYSLQSKSTGKLDPFRAPQVFAPEDLHRYNGVTDRRTLVGVNGKVYDVTGTEMYAPGSHYNVFTGHDASVALAKLRMDGSHLDEQVENADLTDNEKKTLRDWEAKFDEKYKVVGRVDYSKKHQ